MSPTINRFISSFMKDNCRHIESDNIKKIYNKEFDVLIYKHGKKANTIVIDKRKADQTVVYNNLETAMSSLSSSKENFS